MRFFGSLRWSLEELAGPWGDAASLYRYILANPGVEDLPDDQRDPRKVNWAFGALDGIMSHHVGTAGPDHKDKRVTLLMEALIALVRESSDASLRELYELTSSESLLSAADPLRDQLKERLLPDQLDRVARIGRYFATGGDRRDAVKFGIFLLGIAGDETDFSVLRTLSLHDEFTLFAAVALLNLGDDPEQCLWRIARNVHGWGRIHAVERLHDTNNPDIQAWMLRGGFHNSVMDEYLAAICARTGKLHEALRPARIDGPLFDNAASLLSALIQGGPAEDIHGYEDAPEALEHYLRHVAQTPGAGLAHLLTINDITRFLSQESWHETHEKGWTEDRRSQLLNSCNSIRARMDERRLIEEGLKSENELAFYQADVAARDSGMDTWAIHFSRVHKDPMKSRSWFQLLQQTDNARIDELLSFVLSVLPLQDLATGPDTLVGLGPGYDADHVLDTVLQALQRFPGRGWPLIRTGLQNRTIRNRNMALNALLAWPRESWPADALAVLESAYEKEPQEDVKQRIAEALRVH
ncbi:MAG TPA: hypothetical protein VGJ30_02490 [Candidatus Angelobacter sp.]|jgi:hypothetical protein